MVVFIHSEPQFSSFSSLDGLVSKSRTLRKWPRQPSKFPIAEIGLPKYSIHPSSSSFKGYRSRGERSLKPYENKNSSKHELRDGVSHWRRGHFPREIFLNPLEMARPSLCGGY